jgi:hypothetical protein
MHTWYASALALQNASVIELKLLYGAGMLLMGGDAIFLPF